MNNVHAGVILHHIQADPVSMGCSEGLSGLEVLCLAATCGQAAIESETLPRLCRTILPLT